MKTLIVILVLITSCGQRFNLPDGRWVYEGDYCSCRRVNIDRLVCANTSTVLMVCQRDVDNYCRWLAPTSGGVL